MLTIGIITSTVEFPLSKCFDYCNTSTVDHDTKLIQRIRRQFDPRWLLFSYRSIPKCFNYYINCGIPTFHCQITWANNCQPKIKTSSVSTSGLGSHLFNLSSKGQILAKHG